MQAPSFLVVWQAPDWLVEQHGTKCQHSNRDSVHNQVWVSVSVSEQCTEARKDKMSGDASTLIAQTVLTWIPPGLATHDTQAYQNHIKSQAQVASAPVMLTAEDITWSCRQCVHTRVCMHPDGPDKFVFKKRQHTTCNTR